MMSEKRFTVKSIKNNHYILKNPRIHLDFIEMLGDALTSEEIVEELNQLDEKVVELAEENEQLKQEIKQYWKCRDKWKQEAKELKKEADYFERKKCEYWNMYNEAHSDRIILKKENEELRKQIQNYEQLISDSYVGEEETLDGFIGKYVILEDELQKYING